MSFFVAILFAQVLAIPVVLGSSQTDPSQAWVERLSEKVIRELEKSDLKKKEVGLWVGFTSARSASANTQNIAIFGQNADQEMIPASLSKLVTLGAVLHELHPGFKFKTSLLSDGKIENQRIKGNLYLKGGGDPSFVSENMWFLVNEFTRSRVLAIDGDIIVDSSRFDAIRWGDDRQEERVDRAYDAPVGAMSMNWNSVNVFIRPGDAIGDRLKIYADVSSPYIKIRNETKTVAAGRGKTVSVERVSEKGFDGDVIVVTGAMALGHPETVIYKNITNPDLWSGYNLVEFLNHRGIKVAGKVRTGQAPKDSTLLAVSESKPLSLIAADMAKWSNNYVAEMLVKSMAAEAGQQGTMEIGINKVHEFMRRAGMKDADYQFVNAAGLTRKNRMSAAQIGRVLDYVRSDFTIFPEFLAALPIAGVDGTLRNRMKNGPGERWIRAKTGLLNGVVGLAGFAGRSDGTVLPFAFIYNGAGKEDRARATFDQMAARLVED